MWTLGAFLSMGVTVSGEIPTWSTRIVFEDEPLHYCAKMRDGRMVVIFEGKEISGDVFLRNGTTVKPDGTIITKDGVRFHLKEGQCIDQNGVLVGDMEGKPY